MAPAKWQARRCRSSGRDEQQTNKVVALVVQGFHASQDEQKCAVADSDRDSLLAVVQRTDIHAETVVWFSRGSGDKVCKLMVGSPRYLSVDEQRALGMFQSGVKHFSGPSTKSG